MHPPHRAQTEAMGSTSSIHVPNEGSAPGDAGWLREDMEKAEAASSHELSASLSTSACRYGAGQATRGACSSKLDDGNSRRSATERVDAPLASSARAAWRCCGDRSCRS